MDYFSDSVLNGEKDPPHTHTQTQGQKTDKDQDHFVEYTQLLMSHLCLSEARINDVSHPLQGGAVGVTLAGWVGG